VREKWRPKPPPPPSRAGALGFIFVLVLCAVLTAALFLLNPLAPAARLGALLGVPEATPTVSSVRASAANASNGKPWQLFLPLIDK